MALSPDTKKAVKNVIKELERQEQAVKKQWQEAKKRSDYQGIVFDSLQKELDNFKRKIKAMKKDIGENT